MKPGVARRPWSPDRMHRVAADSMWSRRNPTRDTKAERWKVTSRFRFEQGSNGEMLSVRLHCFGGASCGRVRHMSEARFLRLFVPI